MLGSNKFFFILASIIVRYSISQEESVCSDELNWVDSYGRDCSYYDEGNFCEIFGNCCMNMFTANLACCACGGGTNYIFECEDDTDFRDCNGNSCLWYGIPVNSPFDFGTISTATDDTNLFDTRCTLFGSSCPSENGLYATTQCCFCGGGFGLFTHPSTNVQEPSTIPQAASQVNAQIPSIPPSLYPSSTKASSSSVSYSLSVDNCESKGSSSKSRTSTKSSKSSKSSKCSSSGDEVTGTKDIETSSSLTTYADSFSFQFSTVIIFFCFQMNV